MALTAAGKQATLTCMNEATTIFVSSKGQVTLPVEWRREHGLDAGGRCDAIPVADGLLLKPRSQRIGAIGLSDFLLEQEAALPPVERHTLPFK